MVISAVIALIAIGAVLIFVKSEVDRFIFTMPIFAGWILFNILMLPDDEEENKEEPTPVKKKARAKSKS